MEIFFLIFFLPLIIFMVAMASISEKTNKIPKLSEVELTSDHIALFMYKKQKAVESGYEETRAIRFALKAVIEQIANEQV